MSEDDSGLGSSPPANARSQPRYDQSSLDLSAWPPIYLVASHFETEDLHEFEEALDHAQAVLTYSIDEAEIVLSRAVKKARIKLDLRSKGLHTEEAQPAKALPGLPSHDSAYESQSVPTGTRKRKHDELEAAKEGKPDTILIDDSSTESEGENVAQKKPKQGVTPETSAAGSIAHPPPRPDQSQGRIVNVVRTEWFTDSKAAGQPLPLDRYITYTSRVIKPPDKTTTTYAPYRKLPDRGTGQLTAISKSVIAEKPLSSSEILQRAAEDAPASQPGKDRFGRRKYHYPNTKTPSANPASWEAGHGTQPEYAHLLQQTTTDYEGTSSDLPEPPEWVKAHVKYACQRLTPKDNPNDEFIKLLDEIKLARLLTNDEIGVRAYATSIAALLAYAHKLSNPKEIIRLPGCDSKIANLWIEWKNTGKIQAVEDAAADADLNILKLFWNIWGVGVTTAREFYFDKGWTELDDIVEYGWSTLQRVQQIGVKYYDEFLDLIPRAEVESICKVVHQHAVKVRDDGIQSMIVGGYRRGKEACGDVDIVVSHPDEAATHNIVEDIVASLEDEGWITHTLTLSLNNSKRGQQTLPFRTDGGGHGFDTLDKALIVWQDPSWSTKEADLATNPKAKNPNIHRRVDIIIAPWRTVGCAIVGWSGGTTFERDLRRYAKNVKGWKFDSSGVRDRGSGEVVDIEGFFSHGGKDGEQGRAKTMEEAERRVFEGFGLVYRAPTERCTQ
ncbi:Putative DNA-directed DNA polymerase X, DNA polymerase beta-like domain-containing protein [Septoria linicola]|uniref:DNA-directed DNA polymerase n=1 Tax=Septoria linicola TaxID=215465 RepID=A0A9Q9EHT4_9PEZI|nr:putative DNA-directed DNA polymerase X, DNA polymerase beta-like domain-containing protein [Septoria linicola]USW52141.1 Putative DNA-directed DNA polymerase X, DNA polymerase beta-like domain-containing protein [Septoria linicola]